jgi:hypothetical protein
MSKIPDMNLQWRTVEVSDAHVSEGIAMGIVCHGRRIVSQLSLQQNHGRSDCNMKANIQNKKQAACCLMVNGAMPIYPRERSKLKLPFEWI